MSAGRQRPAPFSHLLKPCTTPGPRQWQGERLAYPVCHFRPVFGTGTWGLRAFPDRSLACNLAAAARTFFRARTVRPRSEDIKPRGDVREARHNPER